MITHLSDEQLIGYTHQTLADDQREAMDRHLAGCPDCRARLTEHEALQRRIHHTLLAELKAAHPSVRMRYAAIAPRLQRSSQWARVWKRISGVVALTTFVVLMAVLVTLFRSMSQPIAEPTPENVPIFRDITSISITALSGASQTLPATGRLEPNTGWFVARNDPQSYDIGIDYIVRRSDKASGYIKSRVADPQSFGNLMQTFRADAYRGKRLRLSVYVKAEQVEGWAVVWMRVDGPPNEMLSLDNMQDRPIQGTRDWAKYELVLDVPEDSASIAFGLLLLGKGQVWIDDVQFDGVGHETPTTATVRVEEQPLNLDFEADRAGWFTGGNSPQDFTSGINRAVAHSGQASGYVKSKSLQPASAGMLSQMIKADAYRGRRIRLSGYIKTDQVGGRAGLTLAIYGPLNQWIGSYEMRNGPVQGTTDWQPGEIVVDVPENSVKIMLGLSLDGTGQVWADDFRIELVGADVPTTGSSQAITPVPTPNWAAWPARPDDLDFEIVGGGKQPPAHWFIAGSAPQDYEISVDAAIAHGGRASGAIQSRASAVASGFGTLAQVFRADAYRGQRLRLSGYLKAEQVGGSAGLWMRIDDAHNAMLSFDNMQDRPIRGTRDWAQYEIVLDVPENSKGITFGVLLYGSGKVWIDDVLIEAVGADVPTTDLFAVRQPQPLNLGFED